LLVLLIIIAIGKISLFGSICYLSIYFLYVCAVSATHFYYEVDKKELVESSSSFDDLVESGIPLLGYVDDDTDNDSNQKPII
jgi:sodium/potassium/calcium exchanger 6